MTLRFRGNYPKLQKYVSIVDPQGRWRDLEHGGKQYRTDKGAVVNWWKASGKILFQGQGSVASKFEQAFIAVASAKGRLEDEDGKSLRDLKRVDCRCVARKCTPETRLLNFFLPSVKAKADA
jgi:hypothetical protein